MAITEYAQHVTAFILATGPAMLALGMLGHALVALGNGFPRFSALARIGKVLEGLGADWKRISEAFKPADKQ
jgi:hypothetical protein